MVVFSFVNSGDGGYCITSGRATMKWRGLPYDLEGEMEGVKQKGEEIKGVSVGRNGDWFLRTNTRYACKTERSRADWNSNVERFAQLVQKAGLSLTDFLVQFFTFVPDPTGYVAVLHKTDGSITRCSWHNVPQKLDKLLEREGPKGVRHVTVGVNGSYVVIMNSGVVWWSGVPVQLKQLLEDAERKKHPVATASLSLISPNWYFVQFADGSTKYILPEDWHNSVNSCTAPAKRVQVTDPKMTTSHSPGPPSRSHTRPQHAQSGSSGPVSTGPASSGPVDSHGGSGALSRSRSHPQHAPVGSSNLASTSPAGPVSSGPVDSYGGSGARSRSPQHAQFGSSNPVSTSPVSPVSPGPVDSYGGSGARSHSRPYPQHTQLGSSSPVSASLASPANVRSGPVSSFGGEPGVLSHSISYSQGAQFGSSGPVGTSPTSPISPGPVNSYGGGSGAHSRFHSYPQHAQLGSSGPVGTGPANPVSSNPVSLYGGGSGAHSHPQRAQFGSSNPVSTGPASPVNSYSGGTGMHPHPQQIMQFGLSNPVSTSPASPASFGPVNSYSGDSGAHSRSYSYPQHAQFGSSNPVSTGTGPVSPVISSPVSSHGDGANRGYTPFTPNLYHGSVATGVPQQPVYNNTSLYNGPMAQSQPWQQWKPQEPQQQQRRGFDSQRIGGMLALASGAVRLARALDSDSDSDGIGFSF